MSDITGKKFGKLTVLGRDYSYKSPKHTKWICKCECGNTKSIFRDALMQGRTKSCGCSMYANRKGQNKTHGMSKTRIYQEWFSMKLRCTPNSPDSKNYYDRGIRVCEEWQNDFMAFYNWAISHGYAETLTIDRIDNDKGYSPNNCRWITIAAQQANKTTTIWIEYDGVMYCLRTLCTILGFPYKTAHRRYSKLVKKGLPVSSDKIFAPINKSKIPFKYRK